jgi:hypothetical protein
METVNAVSDTDVLAVDRTALVLTQARLEEFLADLKARTFAPEDAQTLGDFLEWVQAELKGLEAEREALVRPLIDDKARIDGYYRTARAPGEALKALLEGAIGKLQLEAAQAREAALMAAQEASAAGDHTAVLAHVEAATTELTVAGTRTTPGWDYEVLDFAALPDAYKQVNTKLIDAACKAFAKRADPPTIPGVKFTKKVTVAPTGRRKDTCP